MKQDWILNTGSKPDVAITEVLFENGETRLTDDVYSWEIPFTRNPPMTVKAYRPAVAPEDNGVIVSFEDMVAGIVEDADGVEVVPSTNPKKQYGVQSIPLSMWTSLGSAYGALAFYNGALKYGKANYANTPVEASIYIDGAMRHLAAWAAGEEYDPADNVPNLGGVLANIGIILEARAAGTLIDDRAKQSGYLLERDKLRETVKHLNELHAGKTPKHFTMGD